MFISWLRKRLQRSSSVQRPRMAKSKWSTGFRPGVENLEERAVPAFLAPADFAAGANPYGIAVGDFNGDGKSDMAVANGNVAGSVSILLSNGDGTFAAPLSFAAGANPYDATAGDFNADGKADLAVTSASGTVNVLMGNGDGTFGAPTMYAVGASSHSVKIGDFNNDSRPDIATMNYNSASVLLGNGDGTFQPTVNASIPGNNINAVVGDFNHDGNLDMATSNTASIGYVAVLSGKGDDSFAPAVNYYANSAPVYLAAGDFNNDGYDDFAVANSYAATSMSVLMNNGNGTYAAPHLYNIAQTGWEIEVADFNNDGYQDFGVRGSSAYMVGLGKGDGTFYAPASYPTTAGRFEMGTHGDFNGDGAVDFAYPSGAGVTVLMNANTDMANTAVGFTVSMPATTTSGSALPVTITAIDKDGNRATGFAGNVYITSSDPGATLAVPYVFTPADAGTRTFNGSVRLVTLGEQTVTVASPTMTTFTGAVTVTAAVTHFAVSAPTAAAAGDTIDVTVTALDAANNVGTGYTSTVHFSSTDVQAGLPANYTFTAADAGVHTFAVTLKSAGSKWISVAEVGSASTGGLTGGSFVNVTPIAASTFALAGVGGAIGVARPVTIVARDLYGNLATSFNGTVHIASSDPRAVLPADTTLVNGVATVNVTLLTIGSQTITATDVASSITGSMLSDATAPIAKMFVVAGYPSSVAGIAQTFTVTVIDTIDQVAAGYAGTIYFSSSDIQAGLPASYTFTPGVSGGVAKFSATLKTAGAQSITVRDLTGVTGTQAGVTIHAAAFSGFRLSVPNLADSRGHILVTAGDTIALTVRATDAFGNAVPSYRGKVKFSSTDTLAGLPAAYSFTTADAGVHTFTVDLKTSTANGQVWSYAVVDASNAATLATITNFEVINAAATKFVLSVPTNATPGTPFSVKVTALDAYGNKVKNYFGTVHFASSDVLAGLPTDYSFTNVDGGTASFNVTLKSTGSQTVSVTDAANKLSSSASVSVKAGTTTTKTGGGSGSGGGGGKKV
jgi:hypothetical protein